MRDANRFPRELITDYWVCDRGAAQKLLNPGFLNPPCEAAPLAASNISHERSYTMQLNKLSRTTRRFAAPAVLTALATTLLSGCSSDDLSGGGGGGGGGPVMELRSFNVVGTDGAPGSTTTPAVISTTSAAPFSLDWDLTARGINGLYRVTAEVVSLSGSNQGASVEVLARNCNIGVNTGCAQGVTSFPCRFFPERNGVTLSCPPNDVDFAGRNLMDLFSRSVGLPGTYQVVFEACGFREGTGTSPIDDVCQTRSVNVRFQ
tara:strand:+ start:4253 stop:5035 length:783 start_codon:yes stop_codon:yes gene_type:complete